MKTRSKFITSIVLAFGLLFGAGVSIAPPVTASADAYALTSVHNGGVNSFNVLLDNGRQVTVRPGADVWAVSAVLLKSGRTTVVNGLVYRAASTTPSRWLFLKLNHYLIRQY